MLFYCNNGSKNVPKCYVLRTLPVLLSCYSKLYVPLSYRATGGTQPVQNSAVKEFEGRAYEIVNQINVVSTSLLTRP